jgi:hypothetical protein
MNRPNINQKRIYTNGLGTYWDEDGKIIELIKVEDKISIITKDISSTKQAPEMTCDEVDKAMEIEKELKKDYALGKEGVMK